MKKEYDIIIVGAGPAGTSTAIHSAKEGFKILLLDKAHFPREKICGDGVSGKSVRLLKELDLIEDIEKEEHAKMNGVIFSSPSGEVLEVEPPVKKEGPAGYVVRRYVLDNILFQKAKDQKNVDVREGYNVIDVMKEGENVVGVKAKNEKGEIEEFRGKIVVGADGASSLIASKLGEEKIGEDHYIVAIRTYYEGVEGMKNKIELHFIKNVIPGYFWIFPLPGKRANVGIGMLMSDLKKRRIDLKKAVETAINSPLLKERFKNAKRIEDFKGWGLPLGSNRRKGYGNGYLLVGDSLSLIDPFTGEGIGNALLSGKIASQVIKEAFDKNDFREQTLKKYKEKIDEELKDELETMEKIQNIGRNEFLFNLAIKKAIKNKEIKEMISSTLMQEKSMEYKRKLTSPMFWIKLIFS